MKLTRHVIIFVLVGVALFVLGLALIIWGSVALNKCENEKSDVNKLSIHSGNLSQLCEPSKEAKRAKMDDFLKQVADTFYRYYPNRITWHPENNKHSKIKLFRVYNCTPSVMKERSDAARSLYKEVMEFKKNVNESLLQPRELKSLFQLVHFLKSNFGSPYGEDYYSGDWMMGPSRFCVESICAIGIDIYYHFNTRSWGWQPKTTEDISFLVEQLANYKPLIEQYLANIKYGIKAGMTRSIEECEAGYHSFTRTFFQVTINGKQGILQEWFTKDLLTSKYLLKLEEGVEERWFNTNGEHINASISDVLISNFGEPLVELIKYLRGEYRLHCVPSQISSGLATLPLDRIYYNNTVTETKTTKVLPSGETLDGREAYKKIMYYYTTMEELSPDDVNALGREQLHILYPQVLEIARNYSQNMDANSSIASFKNKLAAQTSYFNEEPFPKNESDEAAFTNCVSLEKAKTACPERYKAFQKWTSYVQNVLSMIDPKTIKMFHFTGEKKTTPSCPMEIRPSFNPSSGSQSYSSSTGACPRPGYYNLPFFMDNYGPIYNAYSVAGHEGRPGHHTQIQGGRENFADQCDDNISWLDSQLFYSSFAEGWALYAENPLLTEGTNIYDDNPLQKYGMLKWQVWRALRLIVDTGLHYRGMKRSEALKLHEDYAWDVTDKATKDVTRYQSNPGQATAYMIGQLQIWNLRKLTKEKLEAAGKKFDEKDFHYQVLSQGQSPFGYLRIHINKYIECILSESKNCDGAGYKNTEAKTEKNKKHLYSQREIFLEYLD